jgi:hypothetical protein
MKGQCNITTDQKVGDSSPSKHTEMDGFPDHVLFLGLLLHLCSVRSRRAAIYGQTLALINYFFACLRSNAFTSSLG